MRKRSFAEMSKEDPDGCVVLSSDSDDEPDPYGEFIQHYDQEYPDISPSPSQQTTNDDDEDEITVLDESLTEDTKEKMKVTTKEKAEKLLKAAQAMRGPEARIKDFDFSCEEWKDLTVAEKMRRAAEIDRIALEKSRKLEAEGITKLAQIERRDELGKINFVNTGKAAELAKHFAELEHTNASGNSQPRVSSSTQETESLDLYEFTLVNHTIFGGFRETTIIERANLPLEWAIKYAMTHIDEPQDGVQPHFTIHTAADQQRMECSRLLCPKKTAVENGLLPQPNVNRLWIGATTKASLSTDDGKILLRFRTAEKMIRFRMDPHTSFQDVAPSVAKAFGLTAKIHQMIFDSCLVNLQSTPLEFGMEDSDLVEITFGDPTKTIEAPSRYPVAEVQEFDH
ncbi:unnamed protein product, partial [Mesorhabditis spiculigera]